MPNGSAEGRTVRLLSWNVHGAIGRDGLCLPERIGAIVREMDADIVALQEIDGRTHLRRRANAFETMSAMLGGAVVEARLIGKPGEEHGHVLWSRWPILRSAVHLLPGGWEQRGVIEAHVHSPSGVLVVYAAHLGLSPFTRFRQARWIAEHLSEGGASKNAVLVGDLNEWWPSGPVHRQLSRLLPETARPLTFPSRRPLAPLDRAYASSGVGLQQLATPREAAIASDHLPLLLQLRLPARQGEAP